jgi:hypothetical protein
MRGGLYFSGCAYAFCEKFGFEPKSSERMTYKIDTHLSFY